MRHCTKSEKETSEHCNGYSSVMTKVRESLFLSILCPFFIILKLPTDQRWCWCLRSVFWAFKCISLFPFLSMMFSLFCFCCLVLSFSIILFIPVFWVPETEQHQQQQQFCVYHIGYTYSGWEFIDIGSAPSFCISISIIKKKKKNRQ